MNQLQFKTLEIEHFKTFRDQHVLELAQPPGLYYITGANKLEPELGANGVGKSTIWDALTWVLWGRTGRDNRPANAIQPWLGKGLSRVHLIFSRNGREYQLVRTRNPNHLELYEPDGPEEITQEEIPKLLGMTEEMFRRTLVLSQSGKLFLDLKPEEQAQMFTEALSLNIWLADVNEASMGASIAQQDISNISNQLATNEARRADVAKMLEDEEKRAELFEQDKAARVSKLEKGLAQLEGDLASAIKAEIKKPERPSTAKLDKLKDELAPLKEENRVLERDVQATQKELAELLAELNATQKGSNCPECGEPMAPKKLKAYRDGLADKVKSQKQIQQQQMGEIIDLKARSDSLEKRVNQEVAAYNEASAGYDDQLDGHLAWAKKVGSIRGELSRWKADLANAKAEENSAAIRADNLKTNRLRLRNEAGDLKTELGQAQIAHEQAKFWVDGFREIRLGIIDSALIELEMAASRHAAMLGLNDWGIKFDTERETKSGSVSYQFSVLLYPPGMNEPIKWESYSGGESQRWQLAISFALSEVLLARAGLNPNIEVLDEPTKGLSQQGVADLLDHLGERSRDLGRAIYFVDHHSLDKGAFSKSLLVEKGKNGSTFRWL